MTVIVSIGIDAVLIVATGGAVINYCHRLRGVRFQLEPLGGALTVIASIIGGVRFLL